jgi:hypothetical protein
MWRSKKFIVISIIAAAVVAAGIGGAAYAKTSTTVAAANTVLNQTANTTTGNDTLLSRVAKILGIDQTKLQDAVKQARGDMQNDKLNTYLQNLVSKGTITQEQADTFKTWWQSKPTANSTIQQYKDWLQARPTDVPLPRVFAGPGFCGGPVRGARSVKDGAPVRGMLGGF